MRFAVPPPVLLALERLTLRGHEAYLVGGCVRDDLLGIPPKDYDIATSATPEDIIECFAGEHLLLHGIKHGTVTPVLSGVPVEITTFRRDGAYTDGRHPDQVVFTTSLQEDLVRRDFTVNALARSPQTGLVDMVGGVNDLHARLIRAVGDPERRFAEDALRILRAVRFAAALGFSVEKNTAQAMERLAPTLDRISVERIAAEWTGALLSRHVSRIADYPAVVDAAVPEIATAYGDTSASALADAARMAEALPPDLPMRWVALFAYCGSDAAQAANDAAARLRLSNALRGEIAVLAQHMHTPMLPDDARLWVSRLGLPMLLRVTTLQKAMAARDARQQDALAVLEQSARDIVASGACLSLRDLAVNGNDLMQIGIPKGPEVGEALGHLMHQVVTNQLPNTREALLDAALTLRAGQKEQQKNPPGQGRVEA